MNLQVSPPASGEYAAFYEKYVRLVESSAILDTLEQQAKGTAELLWTVPQSGEDFSYAPGKWTIKQVVGHLADSERVFAYRALRFARADQTPLHGFEQDDYVASAPMESRKLSDLISEFVAVRAATLALFRSFNQDAWMRHGSANHNEVTVRAIAYIIAGHELHHRAILQERYLPALSS